MSIAAFRQALEGDDHPGVAATLSDGVVLHSPAVIETEYSGRDLVAGIIRFAMDTIEDGRVTDELHGGGGASHAIMMEGRIGAQPLQACLYLRSDAGDRIDEVTFMLRPFHAVAAFVDAMAAAGAQPAVDLKSGLS